MTTITLPPRTPVWPTPGSGSGDAGASNSATPTTTSTPGALTIEGNNVADPDFMIHRLIDGYRSAALIRGIQGFAPLAYMYSGLASMTEANYRILQHMFPHIYDGRF